MKRRKWTPKEKAMIVLLGLKEKQSIADICIEHQISQSQYYQWRDQFLSHSQQAFEHEKSDKKVVFLEKEHAKLKTMIGELTIELKKSEEWL